VQMKRSLSAILILRRVGRERAPDYEYQGHTFKNNPHAGRWEIIWNDIVNPVDSLRPADAEQWIDDVVPLNR
jgi:hypothetical protein